MIVILSRLFGSLVLYFVRPGGSEKNIIKKKLKNSEIWTAYGTYTVQYLDYQVAIDKLPSWKHRNFDVLRRGGTS